jgi:hypothetical protein
MASDARVGFWKKVIATSQRVWPEVASPMTGSRDEAIQRHET